MFAQEVVAPPAAPSYLMRMERLRRDQDSCVLVRGDGQYHFEILYRDKTDIFEGVLPADELTDLVRLLSQDRLLRLQQKDIRSPLLQSDLDQLILSILRPGHWQNLSFPSTESRESFRDILGPILKWLDRVQKEKARNLTEESGRNNCNPPHDLQLKQRSNRTSTPEAGESLTADDHQHTSPSTYVVQMFTTHSMGHQVEDTCLIVFESGAYHRVRQWQKSASNEVKAAVMDGSFSLDDLRLLRAILDKDDLQKYVSDLPPRKFIAPHRFLGELTLTRLTIPRAPKPQQITVWKDVDMNEWGATDIKGEEDHGSKLLKPLEKWLKARLPKDKEVESSDPQNPKCLPSG